jgi:hypothetical protein
VLDSDAMASGTEVKSGAGSQKYENPSSIQKTIRLRGSFFRLSSKPIFRMPSIATPSLS